MIEALKMDIGMDVNGRFFERSKDKTKTLVCIHFGDGFISKVASRIYGKYTLHKRVNLNMLYLI